jgi:hypothetical protein
MINRRVFPWGAIPRRTTGELGTAIRRPRPCAIATGCTLAIATGSYLDIARISEARFRRGRSGRASRPTASQASKAGRTNQGWSDGASSHALG